jgi:PAT family beta-lactamase induction signal transducer AmpG
VQEQSVSAEIVKLKSKSFLSENTTLRYLVFSALYVSEGIPIGIMFYAIPAWLAMNNKSPVEIASYLAIIIIPWTFKIIIAPLMDRYTLLSMGRKRPWIIFGQIGLMASFFAFGFIPHPLDNLNTLMLVGFIVNFFGAIQDIAIDGMAVDMIPLNQQARANGVMWGSRLIGQSLSLVIGTSLINVVGFNNAISSMALIVIILILVPIYIRERPGEKLMPWTKGKPSEDSKKAQSRDWGELLRNLLKTIILPSSLLLSFGIFFVGVLTGLVDTLLPIFTVQQLEWTNTSYSHVSSAATLIGGFFGMFVGGVIIDLLGTKKMINILLTITGILLVSFALISSMWGNVAFIYGFVIFYYLMTTLLTIAIFAIGMKISWQKISASQFTLYMTLNNVGVALGSWLLGNLKESLGWITIILLIGLIPFIAFFFFHKINIHKHLVSIEKFETID